MKIGLLLLAVSTGVCMFSPAIAQNIKQSPGQWSISICQQNASRSGYGSGTNYCAQKAEEMRKKGRKVVP